MRVLVTAASKHGATMEIAEAIAKVLTDQGLTTDAKRLEDVSTLTQYDAVVLGSAIYYGHWLKSAVEFADVYVRELSDRPVWLFSSGPVEQAVGPKAAASDIPPIKGAIKPQDHRVFSGSLDKSQLSFAERSLVRIVRAQYDDFRDWDDVRAWASGIAATLKSQPADA